MLPSGEVILTESAKETETQQRSVKKTNNSFLIKTFMYDLLLIIKQRYFFVFTL